MYMYKDSWNVMRRGEIIQAISQMQENYADSANGSTAMELGVAYLWLRDYESASRHFDGFNTRYPIYAHLTFDMAGVAKWCLYSPEEAISQWRDGLKCEFKDGAGLGVMPSLLLYFASVIHPKLMPRAEAQHLLQDLIDDSRITTWPGPLAQFLLDEIDEAELRVLCFDEKFADETAQHHWSSDFFVAVKERSQGNTTRFGELMRKVGNVT